MKRFFFLLPPVTISVAIAIACGGKVGSNDGTSGTTEPAPTTTSDPSPTSTATTFPSPPNLPPKEPTPTGTLTSNPGLVSCGADECVIGKQECCPFEKPPSCLASCGHHQRLCDETADCPTGQQCCGFAGSSGGATASCEKECVALPYSSGGDGTSKPAEHLCKLDAECGPGMRCSRTVNDKGIAYGVCVKKS